MTELSAGVRTRLERELGVDWRHVALAEQVDAAIIAELRDSPLFMHFFGRFLEHAMRLMRERGVHTLADVVLDALAATFGPHNVPAQEVLGPVFVAEVGRRLGRPINGEGRFYVTVLNLDDYREGRS